MNNLHILPIVVITKIFQELVQIQKRTLIVQIFNMYLQQLQ